MRDVLRRSPRWLRSALGVAVTAVATAMLPAVSQASKVPVGIGAPGHILSMGSHTGGTPESTFNFSPFNVTVANPADVDFNYDPTNVALGSVPAGSYNFWTATVNWSPVTAPPQDPYSSEAFIAISPTPANNNLSGVWYASGFATNGANNSSPTTLTWSGYMNFPYAGGTPLNFWGLQTFDGSTAQWDNVTIQFSEQTLPTAPASTAAVAGGSISTPLSAGEVKWFKFHYDGTSTVTIDTLGTNTTGGTSDLPSDTELGLYSGTGVLVLQNDDIDFGGGIYQSSLTLDPSIVPAGDYWLAASGFLTDYGDGTGFSAFSESAQVGTLQINGISVPEPASMSLLALAGLTLLRRHRRRA